MNVPAPHEYEPEFIEKRNTCQYDQMTVLDQSRLTDLSKCFDNCNYEGMNNISNVKIHLKTGSGNVNIKIYCLCDNV